MNALAVPPILVNPGILQALLNVSSVSAQVSFKSPCLTPSPQNVSFIGYITTNKAGTVKYKWVASDGASTSVTDLVFDKAETSPVFYSHSFSSSGWAEPSHIAQCQELQSGGLFEILHFDSRIPTVRHTFRILGEAH